MSSDKKHIIMIVDDEEGIRRALKRLLSEIDAEIVMAADGSDALKMLEDCRPSLIISDQRMPEMNGTEFLHRSQELAPDAVRVLLTGYADMEATVNAINQGAIKYYISKPWDDEVLLDRVRDTLDLQNIRDENRRLQILTKKQNKQLRELNQSLEARVEEQTAEIKAKHNELITSFMETIKAFSTIMEIRFEDVGSHSQRVSRLVRKMISGMDLPQKDFQDIVVAAMLHDIGKISYPDSLIAKHPDRYTQSDHDIIRRHPVLGQSCVYRVSGFEEVGVLIRSHHEHWDGSGYPDGLIQDQTPLGSRLIRLANEFDRHAFANGYPDQAALNNASAFLVTHSGSRFDPSLVRQFIDKNVANEFLLSEPSPHQVLSPRDLKEGMVVAQDIYSSTRMFLLPKGARLSKGMISRLRKIDEADPIAGGVCVYSAAYVADGRKSNAPV